ncbi:MAG: hypothetical protein H5T61_06770 [Thermoflexales bacterium]|nr:hypothetical protein [Thermoflexales bacterium]
MGAPYLADAPDAQSACGREELKVEVVREEDGGYRVDLRGHYVAPPGGRCP